MTAILSPGDRQVRGLLFEAAKGILTRSSAESSLRRWSLKLRERVRFKRAVVAVAESWQSRCTRR
jgi:transposase